MHLSGRSRKPPSSLRLEGPTITGRRASAGASYSRQAHPRRPGGDDHPRSRAALAALARQRRRPIDPPTPDTGSSRPSSRRRPAVDSRGRAWHSRTAGQGLRAETAVVIHTAVAEAILERARAEEVALVAISTHGWSGFRRLLLGSVTDKVVRAAERPVLVVRAPDETSTGKLAGISAKSSRRPQKSTR
jgi:nucleotide-binding universal stress UspA family protein